MQARTLLRVKGGSINNIWEQKHYSLKQSATWIPSTEHFKAEKGSDMISSQKKLNSMHKLDKRRWKFKQEDQLEVIAYVLLTNNFACTQLYSIGSDEMDSGVGFGHIGNFDGVDMACKGKERVQDDWVFFPEQMGE